MVYRPKQGDIGLTRIEGVGGKIIRRLQQLNGDGYEDYEHAFGVTSGQVGRVTIVEAEPGGAVEVPLHYPMDKIRWLVCPDEFRVGMVTILRRQAARKVGYSWLDYAACGAHHLHLPGDTLLKSYISSTKHQMCSQLVDYAAMCAGWHLFDDGRWEGYVTPGALDGLWSKHFQLHNGTAF